jgi:hypothetical protein
MWDTTRSENVYVPMRSQVASAWDAVFTPDDRHIVSIEMDGFVRVYETATGKLSRSFRGDTRDSQPRLSADGKRLVFLGTIAGDVEDFKTVRVYDFTTGKFEREFTGPGNATVHAISPHGRLLASGHSNPKSITQDTTVLILWETATGQEIRRIPSNQWFKSLAFSPDGRLLASGDHESALHLWEVASGQVREHYKGHRGSIPHLDFAPDNTRLASASSDGTALVWRLFDPPASVASLPTLWDDLAKDAATAHKAIGQLLVAEGAVTFLGKHLKPIREPSAEQIKQWITELGSETFATREAAEKNLRHISGRFAPALRRAREKSDDLEVKRRLDAILKQAEHHETRPKDLRLLRALEVLERSGTTDARKILTEVANGDTDALLTHEAKASLRRIARRAK